MEGTLPLFQFNYKKWQHAIPNLFFTLTTVIINFGLAFLLLKTANWVQANDFIILDKNIMVIENNQIPNTKVLKTFVNGELKYEMIKDDQKVAGEEDK